MTISITGSSYQSGESLEAMRVIQTTGSFSPFISALNAKNYKEASNELHKGTISFTDIDTQGNTILHHFCKSKPTVYSSTATLGKSRTTLLVEILDNCPAEDIYKKNREGKSPFIEAVENADIDTLNTLVTHLQKIRNLTNETIINLTNETESAIKTKKFPLTLISILHEITFTLESMTDLTHTKLHTLAAILPEKGKEDDYYNQLDTETFGKTAHEIFSKNRNRKSCLDIALEATNIYATRNFLLLLNSYSSDVITTVEIQTTIKNAAEFLDRIDDKKCEVNLRELRDICTNLQNQIKAPAVKTESPSVKIKTSTLPPKTPPVTPSTVSDFKLAHETEVALAEVCLKLVTANGEGTSGFQKIVTDGGFIELEKYINQFQELPKTVRKKLPTDMWARMLDDYKGEVAQETRAKQLSNKLYRLSKESIKGMHKKDESEAIALEKSKDRNTCLQLLLENRDVYSHPSFLSILKTSSPFLTVEDKLHVLVRVLKHTSSSKNVPSIIEAINIPSYLLFYADKQTGTTIWQIALADRNTYLIDHLLMDLEKYPSKYVPWVTYIKQLEVAIKNSSPEVSDTLRPLQDRLEKVSIPYLIENGAIALAFSYVLKHKITLESEFLDKNNLLHHIIFNFTNSKENKARSNLISHLIENTENSRLLYKTNSRGQTALKTALEIKDFETALLLIRRMQNYGIPKEHHIEDLLMKVSSLEETMKSKALEEIKEILISLKKRPLSYYHTYTLQKLAIVDLSQYIQEEVLELYKLKIAACTIAETKTGLVLESEDGIEVQEIAEDAGNLFLSNYITQYIAIKGREKLQKDSLTSLPISTPDRLIAEEALFKARRSKELTLKAPTPISTKSSSDETYPIHELIKGRPFNKEKFNAALFGKAATALFRKDSEGKTPLEVCFECNNFRAAAILINELFTYPTQALQSLPLQKHAELASKTLHTAQNSIESASKFSMTSHYTPQMLNHLETLTVGLTQLCSKIDTKPISTEPAKISTSESATAITTKHSEESGKKELFALFNKKHDPEIDIETACAHLVKNISTTQLFYPDENKNTLFDYSIDHRNEKACLFLLKKLQKTEDKELNNIPLEKYTSKIIEILDYKTPEPLQRVWLQNLCDKIEEVIERQTPDYIAHLEEDFAKITL